MPRARMSLLSSLVLLLLPSVAHSWDYGSGGSWVEGVCPDTAGQQSPIDMPGVGSVDIDTTGQKIFFKYPMLQPSAANVYNDGHTLTLTTPATFRAGLGLGLAATDVLTTPALLQESSSSSSSSLRGQGRAHNNADSAIFRLFNVVVHAPAEHTIDGRLFAAEIELVHRNIAPSGQSQLAIVSVLLEASGARENAALAFLLSALGPEELESPLASNPFERAQPRSRVPLDLTALVSPAAFFEYGGSLTQPPCDRLVRRFVRQSALPASLGQVQLLQRLTMRLSPPQGNARAVQQKLADTTVSALLGQDALATELATAPRQAVASTPMVTMSEDDLQVLASLQRVDVGDSADVAAAKLAAQRAAQEMDAASVAKLQAEQDLAAAQRLLESTSGAVQKIALQWKVIMCEQSLNGAVTRVNKAIIELRDAVAAAHTVVSGTATPAAAAATATLAKAVAVADPQEQVPGAKLVYWPAVQPLTGAGANPFVDARAETTARVAPGKQAIYFRHLRPSGKQPQGPLGVIPNAAKRYIKGA